MTNEPTAAVDIGATLKKARTQRGLSLESIQQKTRVPRKALEALEANRFSEIPAQVYLRGFLRTYCEFLDVEFEPLWSRFVEENEHPKPAPPQLEAPSKASPSIGLPPAVWIGGAALVLAAGLAWLGVRAFHSKPAAEAPAPPPPAEAAIPPLRPKKAMSLELDFPSRTWIRVETDGRLRFEGWAPAGASQSWKAMDRFVIRTNSPEFVRTVLDGRPGALKSFPKLPAGEFNIEAAVP